MRGYEITDGKYKGKEERAERDIGVVRRKEE